MSNIAVLDNLFAGNHIRIRRGSIFQQVPPDRSTVEWQRIEGMLVGLAVADALGNRCEGLTPEARFERHGRVSDYLPSQDPQTDRRGTPSDDTQLAGWTLEQLLTDGEFVPANVAAKFCSGPIVGAGRTTRAFVKNMKQGVPWYQAGVKRATNGALMRIAPILIPHLRHASEHLWADAALAAMMTHNDTSSIASCVAFVAMLWDILGMRSAPPSNWFLDRFVEVARELDNGDTYATRPGKQPEYEGTFTGFVEVAGNRMRDLGIGAQEACLRTGSGMNLMETVPCVLAILEKHAGEPETAITVAVNDTSDNDTIGAIVGAAVGALHGAHALPQRWKHGLLGRIYGEDDGRLFVLLRQAELTFGPRHDAHFIDGTTKSTD